MAPDRRECPDPTRCPVPLRLPPPPSVTLPAGSVWFRCYSSALGHDEYDPGHGDTRFAPIEESRAHIPTMYLAASDTAALLETVFHEVAVSRPRIIYEDHLIKQLLARLVLPATAEVADLRNPALASLGLRRQELVTTSAEHYPCTRRVARSIHSAPLATGVPPQGIIWHSRQTELAGRITEEEVLVLFGDRFESGRGNWEVGWPGVTPLTEGSGRLRIDEIAQELSAIIEPH